MLAIARKFAGLLVLVLGLALIWLARDESSSFQKCVAEDSANRGTEQQKESSSHIFMPLIRRAQIAWQCSGIFIDENNAVITAIATVLLCGITAGLVFVGYRQIVTARAQLRAYVFAEGAFLVDGGTFPNAPVPVQSGCPNSRVIIKNSGQTPAYDVHHFGDIVIVPAFPPNPAQLRSDAQIRQLPRTSFGPTGATSLDRNLGRALTAFEIQALATGAMHILVFGKVIYTDAFGKERLTEYSLGYAGVYPPPPNVPLMFTEQGNRAT